MIDELKKLKEEYGPVKIAYWLDMRDCRAVSVWISRKSIPMHMLSKVQKLIIKKGKEKK